MGTLIFCIGLTLSAIILHIIILRIRLKVFESAIITILAIFLTVLVLGLVFTGIFHEKFTFLPYGFWQYLHVAIFYVPVMLSYVITYVALEDDSPSMTIARFVEMSGDKGSSRDEISRIISDETLILPRINAMVKNDWIECVNERYFIKPKGLFHSRLFALVLKFLNINREG